MPKIVISILLSVFSHASWSQDFSYKDGKIFYEFIDTLSISKDTLFDKTKTWIAVFFPDAKSQIQIDDKATGKIILKHYLDIEEFEGPSKGKHPTACTIDLTFKENRVRLQVYGLIYDEKYDMEIIQKVRLESKSKMEPALFNKVVKQVNGQIRYLHNNMLESIKRKNDF